MTILLAEDDELTRSGLKDIFENEGYSVLEACDGEEALRRYSEEHPDLVCLDIMMPKVNGYDVCREIRKKDGEVPVIFLSAKSEEIDKVLGLELGADDYIGKPFGVKEVIARIRAVTRRVYALRKDRPGKQGPIDPRHTTYKGTVNNGRGPRAVEDMDDQTPAGLEPFTMVDLEVFPDQLKAVRGDEEIDMSLRDVKMLALFFRNRGKVLDRNTIYDEVWGYSYLPNSRTLDQHISQLRKKIETDPKNPAIITTVHTAGYRYP